MTDKLKHAPGPFSANGEGFLVDANYEKVAFVYVHDGLLLRSPTAPHHCADPKCLGDINRRKLEALGGLLRAARSLRDEIEEYRQCGDELAMWSDNSKNVAGFVAAIAQAEKLP